MTQTTEDQQRDQQHGPEYFVNIEGTDFPWSQSTITAAEIRELAHWDPTQQVIEVNLETNEERTLDDDDVVTLKPGHGFAKKIRFQRG